MAIRPLPKNLTTPEALDRLIRLLLEKETLRRSLKVRDFGPRVAQEDQALRFLERVARVTSEALDLGPTPVTLPRLRLTRRLGRLPRRIALLYLLFLPAILFVAQISLSYSEGSLALWMVRTACLFLLAIPLLIYRRARINIEHECGYVRDSEGRAVIVIDQLPAAQFQSFLAHEYAHHLYFERSVTEDEERMREGWARLVQWQVVQHLYSLEGNPAYLFHALTQIIGELKFACQLISRTLGRKLPRQVRRIPSIYSLNPLYRLLTGTPGFSALGLIDHALGTARYFLEAERVGPQEALRESLDPRAQRTEANSGG